MAAAGPGEGTSSCSRLLCRVQVSSPPAGAEWDGFGEATAPHLQRCAVWVPWSLCSLCDPAQAGEQRKGPVVGAGPYAWWPHGHLQPASHCGTSKPEESVPRHRGMQKDHVGMTLTLRFQPDTCIWENTAACFKGQLRKQHPWARRCRGDVVSMEVPSPACSGWWDLVGVLWCGWLVQGWES